ncbi:MAG: 3-oxoacyl-[acyl-carrier-protein] synthase III C-terminal domain-containing protein [Ignavibacteria bacterium]
MPEIISVSVKEMPYSIHQTEMKEFAKNIFSRKFADTERLMPVFENSEIDKRNLCVSLDYFKKKKSFAEKNSDYLNLTIRYSSEVIKECALKAGFDLQSITDFIYISSTGISTPSPDAYIINELKLNKNINRFPLWGLGCAGGVSGIAKANTLAKANPDAVVLIVTSELCSLTFLNDDFSKSNFIATSLFSDGVAAVLVVGDNFKSNNENNFRLKIKDSRSRIYDETLDVMGWDVTDDGLKVVFSKDIPNIVENNLKPDIIEFLSENELNINDIKNFITHPGGIKVIDAYVKCLNIDKARLSNTKSVLRSHGNMSSATVLYVLDRFINTGFQEGHGLMTSLGPGFSSEMVLLKIE